jgi:putative ABC transport system substrate-binding protein
MMKRRQFITLLGGAAVAWPVAAHGQQAAKVARLGFLSSASASSSIYKKNFDALRAGLRELGYIEGQNLIIESRWAEDKYDRLPELAAELVRLDIDVLITHGTPGTMAAKRATATIPIVMAVVGDAIITGVVSSLARPGGNITGSTFFNPEISAKRLELLREAFPRISRFGVLMNPNNPITGPIVQAMESSATTLKVELEVFEAQTPTDLENAFEAIAARRVNAVTINEDPVFIANALLIGQIASLRRLPVIGFREIAEAGGMMAYGIVLPEMFRRAAAFVHKLLQGAKPGEIPVEQATRFNILINLKSAKALGLEIPPTLLARADEVIE